MIHVLEEPYHHNMQSVLSEEQEWVLRHPIYTTILDHQFQATVHRIDEKQLIQPQFGWCLEVHASNDLEGEIQALIVAFNDLILEVVQVRNFEHIIQYAVDDPTALQSTILVLLQGG